MAQLDTISKDDLITDKDVKDTAISVLESYGVSQSEVSDIALEVLRQRISIQGNNCYINLG